MCFGTWRNWLAWHIFSNILVVFYIFPFLFAVGSGKSVTMYGKNGVLVAAMEFLLNHNTITVSMVELNGSNCFDLSDCNVKREINFNSLGKSIETSAQTTQIDSIDEFKRFMDIAISNRSTKSTNQNATSSRTHAFTIIQMNGRMNQLVFGDLAGYESSEGKENLSETNFINKSLSCLNKALLNKSQSLQPAYNESDLTKFLRPALEKSKVVVFYHFTKKNTAKYLNLIDRLMAVRLVKQKFFPNN